MFLVCGHLSNGLNYALASSHLKDGERVAVDTNKGFSPQVGGIRVGLWCWPGRSPTLRPPWRHCSCRSAARGHWQGGRWEEEGAGLPRATGRHSFYGASGEPPGSLRLSLHPALPRHLIFCQSLESRLCLGPVEKFPFPTMQPSEQGRPAGRGRGWA